MIRRTALTVPIILSLALSAVVPATALGAAPTLRATVVQSGLTNPWDVGFAPGGQMFVTERPGRVRVYASGNRGARLLATTTLANVHAAGEAGAMGLAVDPNFSSNRFVFVCVSRDYEGQWVNQVIRYRVKATWKLAFSKFIIERGMRANTIHNGCAVEVGPDGKLWVSMGDSNDEARAQNPNLLNGKILRVNRNGTVPEDNPMWGSQRTIVYSIGHRNPQGIAFHPETGDVFAIEHGPTVSDEINRIRPGNNYGWPCVTGNNTHYHWTKNLCGGKTFTKPRWHSGSSTIATSGGTFVKGTTWQGYRNRLFVSQLKQSDLRRFRVSDGGATVEYEATHYNDRWGRLRAATLGQGNRLFLTTSNGTNDKVIRITATSG